MSVGINIDLSEVLPRLLESIKKWTTESGESRRLKRIEFFKNEILPIHEKMETIKEDYVNSFFELYELLKNEGDVYRTIELLRKKRLIKISKRKELKAFNQEKEKIKKRSYLRSRELKSFIEFSDSIQIFFEATNPVEKRVSWYTSFIDFFESFAKQNISPHRAKYTAISSGKPPIEIVKDAFYSAIHNDLPNAWQKYYESYINIRIELNR